SQNRQISGGKKRRLNAFFLLATNPRKKLTVGANTLILIAFYGANNV
ncbi:transposase, partial [Acinetobacter baumannii]